MRLSVFLTLAATLPLFAPVGAKLHAQPDTQKVSISKHSTLKNPDGTVNIPALRAHAAYTQGKIQIGFERFERNTGAPHPLAAKQRVQKRAPGTDPLVNFNTELWYGNITVGTPPKTYTVDFDTGSSDLFLPGPECGQSCAGHLIYDPSHSSTAVDIKKEFSLLYGDNSMVSGEQYNETVTIAGLKATSQAVGVAKQYSTGFSPSRFPADGLMGMGFQAISDFDASPVFQTFVAQHKTITPVFAFKLAGEGSELHLGGTNSEHYMGAFTYVDVTTRGYWEVSLGAVTINKRTIAKKLDSIIDTGTTLVIGDTANVAAFYAALGGKNASSTIGPGFYTFLCYKTPEVSLTFSGKAFAISAVTFNLGPDTVGSDDCVGGIVAGDELPFWIVGDVFLMNVYSSFDIRNARVGFATLSGK
ncbi:aspartic peptidase domain-containing protein [Hygrophoropsis aurantiaca]|uniref:Aspartic peptidase domain-containing protein n=1 Tax=Hygrophoropsis aurantiaca TaxID=72124 RepID=A0ACB8AH13_9AGAM|nr:aspartic peptidase domain-containing protein [Hygrophoropsis aurantiaca]